MAAVVVKKVVVVAAAAVGRATEGVRGRRCQWTNASIIWRAISTGVRLAYGGGCGCAGAGRGRAVQRNVERLCSQSKRHGSKSSGYPTENDKQQQ
jgi:hypothetical protein